MALSTQGCALNSELPEEDRIFFPVLDMVFSQHNHPADLGFYYTCECEDTFINKRVDDAGEYFHLYLTNKPMQPLTRYLVKYVNVSNMMFNANDNNAKQVCASITREYNMLRGFQSDPKMTGIVDVFMVCSRVPNIYYIFYEHPDETLEEYMLRKMNSNARRTGTTSEMIPQIESQYIIKCVGTVLSLLHRKGVTHGQLSSSCVFLFRKEFDNPNATLDQRLIVKLGNFLHSNSFEKSSESDYIDSQHAALQEMLKTRDLNALFELATKLGEHTNFSSQVEKELFNEMIHALSSETFDVDEYTKNDGTDKRTCERKLECFLEAMWS